MSQDEVARCITTVFRRFFGFLSKAGVDSLLRYASTSAGCEALFDYIKYVLGMNDKQLMHLIEKPGDEEDKAIYISVFLWKQQNGFIDRQKRISYHFEEPDVAWPIHRQMVNVGYENVHQLQIQFSCIGISTYENEILKCLKTQTKEKPFGEDIPWLASNLNILGPKAQMYSWFLRALDFVEYVLDNFNRDRNLFSITPSQFAILAYDFSCTPSKSWPVFEQICMRRGHASIYDYIAWILGFRMYGEELMRTLMESGVLHCFEFFSDISIRENCG